MTFFFFFFLVQFKPVSSCPITQWTNCSLLLCHSLVKTVIIPTLNFVSFTLISSSSESFFIGHVFWISDLFSLSGLFQTVHFFLWNLMPKNGCSIPARAFPLPELKDYFLHFAGCSPIHVTEWWLLFFFAVAQLWLSPSLCSVLSSRLSLGAPHPEQLIISAWA